MFRQRKSVHTQTIKSDEFSKNSSPCSPTEVKANFDGISVKVAFIFIIAGLFLYAGIVRIGRQLPIQLKISEEVYHPGRFIGERAQNYLKRLSDIGERIVGSDENEIAAVNFLKKEINIIINHAAINQLIELDHQIVSGSFHRNMKPFDIIIHYQNVQNIIVRIAGTDHSSYSLLINCHFDSTPSNSGGGADGIMCASMLETLRVLAKEPFRPKHNIILLFNGAVEISSSASHGFITKHKWAKECQAVINLDSAGAGDRETLFQASLGNNFVLKHYAKYAPHRSAQSIADEIFQTNIIPVITDFEIFTDFVKISGVDFAFITNGYVYHTRHDNYDNIKPGTYQRVGDNLLALVKSISNSPELEYARKNSTQKSVYFDFLGYIMFIYSDMIAYVLNFVIAIISTMVSFKNILKFTKGTYCKMEHLFLKLLLTMSTYILGWLISCLFMLFTVGLLNFLNITMSWYTRTIILFGLYFCPTLVFSSLFLLIFNIYINYKENSITISGIRTQMHCNIFNLLWTFNLIVSTLFFIRSSYIFLIPVTFNTLSFILINELKLEKTRRKWQYLYIFMQLIPTVCSMQICALNMITAVPLTGRNGSVPNPELLVGVLSVVSCILISIYFIPLLTLLRKPMHLMAVLMLVYVTTLLCIMFTSVGFPYSSNTNSPTPQRYMIFHTSRLFYHESGGLIQSDSGYYLHNMDSNSPEIVLKFLPKAARIQPLSYCETAIFCGLPIYKAGLIASHKKSTWIPAKPPIILFPLQLKLISKKRIYPTVIRFLFEIPDPVHFGLFISPRLGAKLLRWSFCDSIPNRNYYWQNRPVYFITYGTGINPPTKYNFWFELEAPMQMKAVVDISLVEHYKHDQILSTPDFKSLLESFPSWAHTEAWRANYISGIY